MNNHKREQKILLTMIVIGWAFMAFLFFGCTISFQNISTHGTATDLVDENQKASADIDANLEVPLM